MPKVVDHEARRTELVDALLRIVARDGMGAVSVRTVAAEAGCSVRPVQYYFADKAELIGAAHRRVSERMEGLVTGAVRELGAGATPRAVVEAIVRAFLPTTPEARDAVIAYHCFFGAELTDAGLRLPRRDAATGGLVRVIRRQVERHRGGRLPAAARRDVALLVLGLSTIAASVTAGYLRLDEATTLLDHQIDRLLPVSTSGGAPSPTGR